MEGLFADASSGGISPQERKFRLSETPFFFKYENDDLTSFQKGRKRIKIHANDIIYPGKYDDLVFQPFYQIHDSRYANLPSCGNSGKPGKNSGGKKAKGTGRTAN